MAPDDWALWEKVVRRSFNIPDTDSYVTAVNLSMELMVLIAAAHDLRGWNIAEV
jgi:hypothetical protein